MARSAAKKAKTVLFLEVRFAAVAKMHNGAQNVPGRISHHKRLQAEHSLKIKRQKNQAEDHTKRNADTNNPNNDNFKQPGSPNLSKERNCDGAKPHSSQYL